MIVRITDKLGKRIKLVPSEVLPPDANPYADWSCHLFEVGRVPYIMVTNTASLYSMVMPGKSVSDSRGLLERMMVLMGDILRGDGHELIHARLVVPSTGKVYFSRTLNRRVMGSMNNLIRYAKFHIAGGRITILELPLKLNELYMRHLNNLNPRQAFTEMLPKDWPPK